MIALRVIPSGFRRIAIALTSAAALIFAISPATAQQHQRPTPRFAPLPPTTRHPLPPAPAALRPSGNLPAPTSLLNLSSWTPLGPAPLDSNGYLSTGHDLVSGRVTGIAVDPTDANTIYEASAGGGVWKTTDGGSTWVPLTDHQTDLSMGSIAVAPTDHLKIYAGTGEANNCLDCNRGIGILVSNDGGTTWTLNSANGALVGTAVGQIAVDPTNENVAYAAVGGYGLNNRYYADEGIWKTTDGGSTWTNVTAGVSLPGPTDPTTVDWSSVVVDPNTPTIVYASIGDYSGGPNNGVYRSTDSGATWALLANAPVGATAPVGRIALAISPAAKTTGQHVLYIAIENVITSGLEYFGRSDNADAATPTFTDLTAGTPDFLGAENGSGQGWYDIAVNVDANGNVYASGVENYNAGGTQAIITSSNLGVTWTDISVVNGFEPHTDNHAIAFDASNRMLAGNDGGIYRYDPTGPSWTDLNSNLETIQFQGVGLHPKSITTVIGGAQDNGTELYSDNLLWTQDAGGDGGPPKISQTNPLHCYHQYYGGYIERSDDGCQTFTAAIYNGLYGFGNGNFYTPFTLDPTNGDHILFGTDFVNESTDAGNTWIATGTPGTNGFNPADSAVDSVAISPANGTNPAVIYAATGGSFAASSQIFVAQNPAGAATMWTEADLPACTVAASSSIGCRVNQIVTDPNDPTGQTAFAVVSTFASGTGGHVFMTTNMGGNWTDISGSLPNMPVWSIQVDTDANKTAYISTDNGVYSAASPYTTWALFGTGLPNAQGYDLELNSTLHVLAVATHGRGAWEILTPGAQLALTVNKTGAGTGTVTSTPSGINCGSTCTASFAASSQVTLTATADANSTPSGWTGCDSVSSAGVCTVSLNAIRTVTADFTAVPAVTWPTASAITYGQTLSSSTLTGGSASYNSTPVPGTFTFDSLTSAPRAGVQSEAVTFTPTDTTNYSTVKGTVNVTVNQAAPVIIWSPSGIFYGTALSDAQLNATASVPGTFVYTPAAGTLLTAGPHTLKAVFTPTDSVDYADATGSIQFTVNKAPLTVTANNQTMPFGGTVPTLTGTISGEVTGDGITATFATTATSASPIGQYAITDTLNDPNSKLGNYSVNNIPGTLTVTKVTPKITWATPAAIGYGTALSATQLNATASVKGTFAYSPAAGTILSPGTHTLTATFTPADTSNTATATASVTLRVNPATATVTLTSSANPSDVSQAITFTATVSSSAGTPTGTVSFFNGTMLLGTSPLSKGVATYTASVFTAAGSDNISAEYSGDTNFTGALSNTLVQQILAPAISSSPSGPTTETVSPGNSTSFALNVVGSFNTPTTFSVDGLPSGAGAIFNPPSLPTGASLTSITLTIQLPQQTAAIPARPGTPSRMPLAFGLLLLPLFGLRKLRKGNRFLMILLLSLIGASGAAVLSGCGGHSTAANSSPQPQSYNLTVTATAGSSVQTTKLTLIVE